MRNFQKKRTIPRRHALDHDLDKLTARYYKVTLTNMAAELTKWFSAGPKNGTRTFGILSCKNSICNTRQ